MIETLTPEQEGLISIYRDKWIEIGLSTSGPDYKEAALGVQLAYEAAGLKSPSRIVWCDSPLEGVKMVEKVESKDVFNRVSAATLAAVANWSYTELSIEVWDYLHTCFISQHLSQLWGSIWLKVIGIVCGPIISGQSHYETFAFCEFLGKVLANAEALKVEGLSLVGKNCSYWWAFEDVAILVRKPESLNLTKTGHITFKFRDGFEESKSEVRL